MLQFMSEGKETYALSSKELQLFEKWSTLTSEQKELLLQLIENMK